MHLYSTFLCTFHTHTLKWMPIGVQYTSACSMLKEVKIKPLTFWFRPCEPQPWDNSIHFAFFSYCPNSQQQLLESFLYCKIKYSDHSEKSIVNLFYSWKQWDRQCSMWVMAAGSLSSFSVRRAVKGYDWHEVLSLVPRHTSYPLLPGPFVLLNTHTHRHHLLW